MGSPARPALLSHCYADPELPLLREAGVYAVRSVTQRLQTEQLGGMVKILMREELRGRQMSS